MELIILLIIVWPTALGKPLIDRVLWHVTTCLIFQFSNAEVIITCAANYFTDLYFTLVLFSNNALHCGYVAYPSESLHLLERLANEIATLRHHHIRGKGKFLLAEPQLLLKELSVAMLQHHILH